MYRDAFERLPEYLRKPNNEKLYDIAYTGFNDLRDSFYAIQDSRSIDNAFGKTLDYLGANVGQPRPAGMSDEEYRLRIKVKIVANRSDGDIPTINRVALSLFKEQYLGLSEMWVDGSKEPAAIMLYLKPPLNFTSSETVNMVVSGGVRIYWSMVFEQKEPSIFIGAFNMIGEEVVILPRVAKEPQINSKVFIGAFHEGILETVELKNFSQDDKIKATLDVRNVSNIVSQLEQIKLGGR